MWLNRCPWLTQIILFRGREFLAEFSDMVRKDYGIKKKPITTRNPQANGIIERIHQTIGHMICTFCFRKMILDKDGPLSGILGAFIFATRTTAHITNKATPTQLVFGCDVILNVKDESDWAYIKERKDKISLKNNR